MSFTEKEKMEKEIKNAIVLKHRRRVEEHSNGSNNVQRPSFLPWRPRRAQFDFRQRVRLLTKHLKDEKHSRGSAPREATPALGSLAGHVRKEDERQEKKGGDQRGKER